MYEAFFNPTVLTISLTIYLLTAICVVLYLKLVKAQRDVKKHRDMILYINDRLLKLEDNPKFKRNSKDVLKDLSEETHLLP